MEYLNISPTSEPSSPLPPSETHEPGPTNSSGSGSETSESNPAPVTINMDASGDATISAAFQPSLRIDDLLPDLTLISSNNVYFYVHRHRITGASSNSFGGLLLFDWGAHRHGFLPSLHLPETGDVINVVLHTMYGLSCLHFHPSLETVEAALDALIKYGVPIQTYTAPFQPLYQLILSHAPYRPIETYALAGRHQLEDLAVTVSGHLLSFDLSRITDDLAKKMGPVYLKRLFLLHQSRLMALKELLLKPPANHPVTPGCNPNEHGKLTRAWALTTAQLVWDAMPSISPNSLRALLEPIAETIVCESCRKMLQQRIQEVMYSWGQVKPTI